MHELDLCSSIVSMSLLQTVLSDIRAWQEVNFRAVFGYNNLCYIKFIVILIYMNILLDINCIQKSKTTKLLLIFCGGLPKVKF